MEDLNSDRNISAFSRYKIALETRNFEISLFWQRSNYFLILNSALALGFFRVSQSGYQLVLAVVGLIASVFWYRVNLGSKFWQSRWENRLAAVEREIAPDLMFFDSDPDAVREDVRESLDKMKDSKSGLRQWIDRQVLEKPSVSYYMILLSLLFCVGWNLSSNYLSSREQKGVRFTFNNKPDIFSLGANAVRSTKRRNVS